MHEQGLLADAVAANVRVEDAGNPDIYIVLTMEPICQGFGDTLAFIVTSTRSNWIDVAPTVPYPRISDSKSDDQSTY